MFLIAHRGLLNGPDAMLENNPDQVTYTLSGGFHCEVDLWRLGGKWYLGHDRPTYVVDDAFLRQKGLWLHCKNAGALFELPTLKQKLNYFWHENDDYTITSRGYIWAYPGKIVSRDAILVLPEIEDKTFQSLEGLEYAGICSDYINLIDDKLHDRRT